ncbi:MAG: nitroreductase family protein [Candidatus Koribacter versatilis]|uniref:Nitroreductase family protein n=1 Tax=Candidatus Korobacter versatilis TaxID=658062 RepID=A0A932A924_9BACT|nr:nitroreductase family protein [Candidatus Koribacter versatilis]
MTAERAKEKPLSEVVRERRATPHFDPSAPVHEGDLAKILSAGLHAPSGYNLQPWRFVVVRDPEQRKKLRAAAMNQPKVEEAPVVIVACGDKEGWKKGDLDDALEMAKEHGYGGDAEHAVVKKNVTGFLGSQPGSAGGIAPDLGVWVNRHVMIAFTTVMWMAEALGYDTAPMEGFDEASVKKLLHIPDSVRVVALLAIGHRKGEDKPYGGRFPIERLCFADDWGKPLKLPE